MVKNEILKQEIIEIIYSKLESRDHTLNPNDETTLIDGFGLDSLDLTEVIMEIENVYKIRIRDDDVEHFVRLGVLVDHVHKKIYI